tara:strand:+ start:2515 stop:2946 length:432 start_codon:yes stop_codon:yes gene_type:complete
LNEEALEKLTVNEANLGAFGEVGSETLTFQLALQPSLFDNQHEALQLPSSETLYFQPIFVTVDSKASVFTFNNQSKRQPRFTFGLRVLCTIQIIRERENYRNIWYWENSNHRKLSKNRQLLPLFPNSNQTQIFLFISFATTLF